MRILRNGSHLLLILLAVLVILICLASLVGTRWVNRTATDVTLKAFTVIEMGVGVIDTGVERVKNLVATGRTEVQLAGQTIEGLGHRLEENGPVLIALNNRLGAQLAPTVQEIGKALAPIQSTLVTVNSVLQIANTIPFVQERAPELARFEPTLIAIEGISTDTRQAGDILRAIAVDQKSQLTQEAIGELTTITTRIDNRFGEVQSTIVGIQNEVNVLQYNLAARKSRLLLTYNLVTLAVTLLLIWLIYSQIVVICRHWDLFRATKASPKIRKIS